MDEPLDIEAMLSQAKKLPVSEKIPDTSIVGVFHSINFWDSNNGPANNLSLNLYGVMLILSEPAEYKMSRNYTRAK